MKYLIYIIENDNTESIHSGPVAIPEMEYLKNHVFPYFKTLSHEEYKNGHVAILNTGAKSSYISDGDDVLWCIEWPPGLIVVRFLNNGLMEWTAMRSPNPEFGGREAAECDWIDYDEDAVDHQYNLIFKPWDAQFDKQYREERAFEVADKTTVDKFTLCLKNLDNISVELFKMYDDKFDLHIRKCKENLKEWCGKGIVVNT